MSAVIPDIAPFVDTTGKVIEGRRQWREHLKSIDAVEMGHADIKEAESKWAKRQREAAAKVEQQTKVQLKTDWQEPKDIERDPTSHKRLWCKVAERLDGRPVPSRKQLLRIVIEEAKKVKR